MVENVDSTGLRRVLDSVALGVFAVDREWNITFFNREAERITGYSTQEALGMQCRDVFRSERCSTRCYLRQAMRSKRSVLKVRLEIVNRHNRRIPLEVTAAVLYDEQGVMLGGVESLQDLTVRQNLETCVRQSYRFSDLVGRDPAMRRLFETMAVVAPTDAAVLLQGETGTGKDLVARAIHNLSQRASGPFVKVNCAAIPANLLESELFGYRKGAFTDARQDKPGLFAKAAGGSVFLDEVGDIPRESQAKLLQVLDEHAYIPLGATDPESVDVRLIAATNRDLAALVQQGAFRSDLYYRLRVVEVNLPPLRRRRCDIPMLIEHFLMEFAARQGKPVQGVAPKAMHIMLQYDYPGNVRELRHIVEHGVILSTTDEIRARDLPRYLMQQPDGPFSDPIVANQAGDDERERLRQTLDRYHWRVAETARALGIDRTTLWRRRKKHGL